MSKKKSKGKKIKVLHENPKQSKNLHKKKLKKGQKPVSESTLTEQAVMDFLGKHPEFFLRYPQFTARLQLPHETKGTASLVEHQIRILREQLVIERQRLLRFIDRARDYEAIMQRFHQLVLKLISTPDLPGLEKVLCRTLQQDFDTPAVAFKLFRREEAPTEGLIGELIAFSEREHAFCGALPKGWDRLLFASQEQPILSAALIPIRSHHRAGVLAIGSPDPRRFTQEMNTDYLDRLGAVVNRRISAYQHRCKADSLVEKKHAEGD